jgi:hypothetical protein
MVEEEVFKDSDRKFPDLINFIKKKSSKLNTAQTKGKYCQGK